jgi:hypothetical protein
MKKTVIALLLVIIAVPAYAKIGICKSDIVFNRFGHGIPQASVRVCTRVASGNPCTPTLSLYSDIGLTTPITNPVTADNDGRYSFCTSPGQYQAQITGAGAMTQDNNYLVANGDTASGTWEAPAFSDDGATNGIVWYFKASRTATITGVHVRANTPWTACSASPDVKLYAPPTVTTEHSHIIAAVQIAATAHPSGHTSQNYFLNSDVNGLTYQVNAGDELFLFFDHGLTCSQFGAGIVVSVTYEGAN